MQTIEYGTKVTMRFMQFDQYIEPGTQGTVTYDDGDYIAVEWEDYGPAKTDRSWVVVH